MRRQQLAAHQKLKRCSGRRKRGADMSPFPSSRNAFTNKRTPMQKKFYTEDHEWISLDGEIATVGISNYAQEQLGDIVFVELPQIGAGAQQGDEIAVVESVKAASEI